MPAANEATTSVALVSATGLVSSPDIAPPLLPGGPALPPTTDLSDSAQALWTQHGMDRQLKEMGRSAQRLFPHLRGDASGLKERIRALCLRAYEATDHEYVAKEAQEWAGGYEVPQEYVAEDEADLARHDYDLESLARERFERVAHDRLSAGRVQTVLSPSNPEYSRMMEMSTVGVTVHTDPDFIPNTDPAATGTRPTLSKGYLSAPNAVNKCNVTLFREPGLAIIVKSTTVPRIRGRKAPGYTHLSKYSWAPKHGKKCGRPVSDASSAGRGNVPLNTPLVKAACDRQWGEIHHPVIREWALAVLEFAEIERAKDPNLDLRDVVQYKMDLDCAFSLISWRIEDVRLMANEMTDGLTIFHLCGQFGWTGTPSAFQVVTRALAWELANSPVYGVSGRCLLYVDDIWGICLRENLDDDIDAVRRLCTSLLGKVAIAEHKTVVGRRLPVLAMSLTWTP